ncbi:NlpC/P60 family protein [Metaclostridioides mangenotii]|uniref:C40 family peptidase n=1 Tax=Metaclostridioides mangenotii TaxID=1540 RepID=UPI0026EF982B|nr:NlpC/P60 family protein [Clostridioides mangenotii]
MSNILDDAISSAEKLNEALKAKERYDNSYRLLIAKFENLYEPITADSIVLDIERKGSPSKLTFTVVKDSILDFCEGNSVRLVKGNTILWYGRIFQKKRDKDQHIQVTAYDRLRYFKNKDTLVYENKTASELVKMIAKKFEFTMGTIEDTKYKIASKIEDNKTYLDMIYSALDDTIQNSKEMYVLYCDRSEICLKNIKNMKLDLLINNETAENFDYNSSIDDQTYTQIKLVRVNEETGMRDVYIDQDTNHIKSWGLLQYYEEIDNTVNAVEKAQILLKLFNKKTKTLKIQDAFGDLRVRPGCTLPVHLNLGDLELKNYMMVENIKHKFENNRHTMDFLLVGGEFVSGLISTGTSSGSKGGNASNMSPTGTDWGHGITAKMLDSVFKGELYGMGETFLKHSNAYKVNPALMAAISIHETGNGSSSLCKNRNNFFGMKGKTYSSREEGIKAGISNLSRNYIYIGKKSLEAIRNKYAPLSDSSLNKHWIPGVSKYYQQIAGKAYNTSLSGTGVKTETNAVYTKPATSSGGLSDKQKKLMAELNKHMGKPYRWGAIGPKTFDCSGLMQYVYKHALGINIPRVSKSQAQAGTEVARKSMQVGDVISFSSNGKQGGVHHVGMYVGDNNFIHAPKTGDVVKKTSLSNSYYNKQFFKARRFI